VSLGVFRLIPIRLSNRDGPTRVSHPVARVKIFKTTPGQSIQVYEVAFSRKLVRGSWILAPSATGLSKPDLHVFAKLFEDCLKRGLEAQAFSGREIGGHDDVLDFLVGHFVDVDLTRQPAS
jgi:hypothetical protein